MKDRGDHTSQATDYGNQQTDQNVSLAIDLGAEKIEALIYASEPDLHPLLEMFQATVDPRFEARNGLANIVDSHRLLPDPAFNQRNAFVNVVHRAPPSYRRPRHEGKTEMATQDVCQPLLTISHGSVFRP
jgi:hypothetical protein